MQQVGLQIEIDGVSRSRQRSCKRTKWLAVSSTTNCNQESSHPSIIYKPLLAEKVVVIIYRSRKANNERNWCVCWESGAIVAPSIFYDR
jgi:hypothetical protein